MCHFNERLDKSQYYVYIRNWAYEGDQGVAELGVYDDFTAACRQADAWAARNGHELNVDEPSVVGTTLEYMVDEVPVNPTQDDLLCARTLHLVCGTCGKRLIPSKAYIPLSRIGYISH